MGDDVEELEFSGDRNHLFIEVEIPDGYGRRGHRDTSADLEIRVPAGSRLVVETVSAAVEISKISGRAEVETVSGKVRVEGQASAVDVETVSGAIDVTGSQTRISAESVSGSIDLKGVAERVEAASVSGSVAVSAGEIEDGRFESVSGSVEFSGSLSSAARMAIEAHSGNITVVLPSDVSASFDVETFSGRIENDFGPGPERTSQYAPGMRLRFSTGAGDAKVSIETFSGTVKLKKR